MIEEPNNMNEFERALHESFEAEALKAGDVIEGTIVAIKGDVALVDVSGKSEAVLDRTEIDDLGTGDPVEVVVVSTGEEIRVSRRLALEAQLKEKLSEAVASGEPVDPRGPPGGRGSGISAKSASPGEAELPGRGDSTWEVPGGGVPGSRGPATWDDFR